MEEKELRNEESVVDSTEDYLAAIKELKQNTVDRQEYEKLKAENKRLINEVVNGQVVDVEAKSSHRDPDAIREELFNNEHTNLDYIKLALELRSSLMAEGKPDPFLPMGAQIAPTAEDVDKAEKAAQIYQECIDYADGDSKLFTQELQRRTNTSIFDRIKK